MSLPPVIYIIKYAPKWYNLKEQLGRLKRWYWQKTHPKEVEEIRLLIERMDKALQNSMRGPL